MERFRGPMWAAAGLAIVLAVVDFLDWEKWSGELYCNVRHPVEAITSSRKTCEEQHIIQRSAGGGHKKNIILINAFEHDYADRSKDKPWAKVSLWWGNDKLKRAYKMGVYANGYHFMVYDYRREGQMTLFEWDGASHLTYVVASLANFITKEMSYLGYQFERMGKGKETQWTDAVLGVPVDAAELYVGVGYGIIGVVVGTIFNPLETLWNVPGAVVFIVKAIAVGLWNTIADLLSLLTLGFIQLQTAAW